MDNDGLCLTYLEFLFFQVFVFNACRGNLRHDGYSDITIPDSLLWFSTEENYASLRYDDEGSLFIQKMAQVKSEKSNL